MDKEERIEYWLNLAVHDLDVFETLFQNEKYDWCLFIGHLVIDQRHFMSGILMRCLHGYMTLSD